ncbi:MAG TPA: DUF4038 domain-containing protein, partial [Candidatus Sulfotelmatobacter sp.]|nr:DUF4038 domain-containing protein [Candidatus Sulfotelmatobacter sp.]
QKFTVAQWSVSPGADLSRESALTGFSDRIGVNPRFFQRLDAKLERLSRAGILSAIAPLNELEISATDQPLPDDQAVLLVRYAVARWGAEPVVWLLAFEGDSQAKQVGRWKRIGQAAFGQGSHAPVLLYPGETPWLLDEFRDQRWVDIFGFQSVTDVTDDALLWTFAGPFPKEWARQPARPLIPFTPYENGLGAQSKKRFSANDVRHAAYWSLLLAPPAGLSYGGQGVVNWDATTEPKTNKAPGARLPLWHKALFMPAAKQMGILASFMNSLPYWRLRPEPKAVATQPGEQAPRRHIVVASTETKDLALVYVPEDRSLDLVPEALPHPPTVTWFNPRTGQTESAVAVVNERASQFPTPGAGDWVLVMRGQKQ